MQVLENLLHSFNTNFVNSVILVLMAVVFISGLWFTKKDEQHDFVHYVPTLLTTMGIFGTFLGIVLGLLDFDQSNIEISIPPLLAGLKTAFITSLVGIFSSLVFKTLSTFSFLKPVLDENTIVYATPEAILQTMNEQVAEIKNLKEDLKESLIGDTDKSLISELKTLRREMSRNAEQAIQENKQQALKQQQIFDQFSSKLWGKLQNFADTLSKSATKQVIEALRHVIADFNHNLTEQFGDNFKQLNKAVANLLAWQDNYKVQLKEMTEQYNQGVKAITATEASVANISKQSQAIPDTMSRLQGVMEINQHQLDELERHLASFEKMSEKATAAFPNMQHQVTATINDIAAAVNKASEHYNSLLTESDGYIKKHISTSHQLLASFSDETTKGINNIASQLINSSTLMGTNISHLETQSEQVKIHSQKVMDEFNATLNNMVTSLAVEVNAMSSTMKNANQNLASDTKQVRDTVIESAEKLKQKLSLVIDEVAVHQVNQAKRTFDAMEDQIRQQGGIAGEVVDTQLKLIDSAMQKEINRVMTEMGLALAQVSGKFVEDYVKLIKAMDEIVNQRVN